MIALRLTISIILAVGLVGCSEGMDGGTIEWAHDTCAKHGGVIEVVPRVSLMREEVQCKDGSVWRT